MTDEAQPPEGQGDAGSTGLYDSYLQTVPEEHRPVVETFLADAAKNVNSRLEEAATLRTTYEPLTKIEGLTEYDPDNLAQLLAWHQDVTASPEAYQAWLETQAREAGLIQGAPQEPAVEGEPGALTPEQVQALLQEQIAPVASRLDELDTQQFIEREGNLIASRFAEIEKEHGSLSQEQKDMIVDLGIGATPDDASLVSGTDWIGTGWERFKAIHAEGQRVLVEGKMQQPPPALPNGATGQESLHAKTFEEAGERAREKLRQSRSQ